MEHLPRLPFSLNPLIAEAKRRARQRRVLVAVVVLLTAALAAGLTLTFRSQGVGANGEPAKGRGIVFAHLAIPSVGGTLDGGGDIYVLRPGGQPKQLMSSRNPLDQPTWSPNGKLLAFATIMCDGNINCTGFPKEVYVANSDGSHQRQLTFPPANAYELRSDYPSWSPDSRRIAFLSEDASQSRLEIVSIANGKTRPLGVHGMINHPVWGRPGIAYLSASQRSSNPPFAIRIADPSTGRGRPFASPLTGYGFQLIAWSSRAKLAALEGSLAYGSNTQHVTVYSRTGRQVGGFQVPKQWTTCGLAWSPHATRLLLTVYRPGRRDINAKTRQPIPQLYTVDPSGKHWQRVPLSLGLTSCSVSWR
jgi:WD40-like Beta Propeller Repeat